jgi:rRNA maturation endonuclease Nob1
MSEDIFDSTKMAVKCPGCGREFDEKVGVLRESPDLRCPGCGETIKIDASDLDEKLTESQRALDDLLRTASKL